MKFIETGSKSKEWRIRISKYGKWTPKSPQKYDLTPEDINISRLWTKRDDNETKIYEFHAKIWKPIWSLQDGTTTRRIKKDLFSFIYGNLVYNWSGWRLVHTIIPIVGDNAYEVAGVTPTPNRSRWRLVETSTASGGRECLWKSQIIDGITPLELRPGIIKR